MIELNFAFRVLFAALAILCSTQTALGSKPLACGPVVAGEASTATSVLNDPKQLPTLPVVRLRSLAEWEAIRSAPSDPEYFNNYYITVSDLPITPENVIRVYARGGKLYQHFRRTDPVTGVPEEHRWEFPYYRGINDLGDLRLKLLKSRMVRDIFDIVFGEKIKHPTLKNHFLRNPEKPYYMVRFNRDPATVIRACAEAERLAQDTTTKTKLLNDAGKAMLTTETWLAEVVQQTFLELVKTNQAYTVEIYTTEHHPDVTEYKEPPGKLVAGSFGVAINGVYTGITLFMDRTPIPGRNKLLYDEAGRLAFLAEIDYLESQGVGWLDSVTVNEAAKKFGGRFLERQEFHARSDAAKALHPLTFVPLEEAWPVRFSAWDATLATRH